MPRDRPALIDWTDEQVRERLRETAQHVGYAYEDYVRELDRRASRRLASAQLTLTVVSIAIALGAVLVTMLKA